MVQLQVLSGEKAGTLWEARRFPVRIGRSDQMDLSIRDPGVWDEHLKLVLDRKNELWVEPFGEGLLRVNGESCGKTALKNGDCIEVGSARLRFWISPARQRGFRSREWLTWAGLWAVALGQAGLIIWLLRQ